ncbi:hypothetical protein [Saccharicrinis aurantiacus]|uniref:hypothetical protein n=1 Tax=Saccharicrinis aurantiacus TaxID=1849719 RepID=UPI0024920B48|nr:hypothetical protein [Saccharicrinis aurantiacus]
MYVDSRDFSHIINNFRLDLPKLSIKVDRVKSNLNKQLGRISKIQHTEKLISWRNPDTKIEWQIYYAFEKIDTRVHVVVIPYTSINHDGARDYFVPFASDFDLALSEKPILFKVFRGHFIRRFRERMNDDSIKAYHIFYTFTISSLGMIVDSFNQNIHWKLGIHTNGIAMVKPDEQALLYDTFVPAEELKPDQKEALVKYFNNINDIRLIPKLCELSQYEHWGEYVTEEKINALLQVVASSNKLSEDQKEKFFTVCQNIIDG